jgi:hypothetical protein
MPKPIITSEDDRVVWGTLIAVTVGVLVWTCILVHDIQKDVSQIKKTLLNIQETLTPIENIKDPVGLINHLRPMQHEYPEANFHTTITPDEPKNITIAMNFTESLESNL